MHNKLNLKGKGLKAYIVVSHAVLKENGGNQEKKEPLRQF